MQLFVTCQVNRCCQNSNNSATQSGGDALANKAKLYIKLMKEAVRKDMQVANSPLAFWDYCIERCAQIYNMTARDHFKIHGNNPHTNRSLAYCTLLGVLW